MPKTKDEIVDAIQKIVFDDQPVRKIPLPTSTREKAWVPINRAKSATDYRRYRLVRSTRKTVV